MGQETSGDINAPMNRADSEKWQASVREDSRVKEDQVQQWRHYMRTQLAERDARQVILDAVNEQRLTAANAYMVSLQAKLDQVELSTSDIVDTIKGWNDAMKVIESIGKTLRPLTWIVSFAGACVGLWFSIKHSGNGPLS